MRHVIVITAVTVMWPAHSLAQERLSFDERIAKLEQELFEGQKDLAKVGFKQLDQLLEELDTSGEVSRETAYQFWTSTLESLFSERTDAAIHTRSLIDQLTAAQVAPTVHPLKWKIVRANFQRLVAAAQHRRALQSRFETGFENLEDLLRTEQELADAEVAYCQSLLQTMPSTVDNVAKRFLAACRLNAALKVYHSSLMSYKNISEKIRLGLRGGTPENVALLRFQVYRWQARVYELRLALEELQS